MNMENKHLTQEDIESFGFVLKVKSIDLWFEMIQDKVFDTDLQNYFSYKSYHIFLNYGMHDYRLTIKADFDCNPNTDHANTLFQGECKTLQDLITILTYIHILPFYEEK